MKRIMDYCWATRSRGLVIKPEVTWSGEVDGTEFEIKGISDLITLKISTIDAV
jgi:hypothetical protein